MSEEKPTESHPDEDKKEKKPKKENKGGNKYGNRKGWRRGRGPEEEEWVPLTNLGRLVKMGEIKTLEQKYLPFNSNKRIPNSRLFNER